MIKLAEYLREVNERLVVSGIRELGALESSGRRTAQLNTRFESLNDGILVSDGNGRIVMLNDAARRVLRVEADADLKVLASRVDALDLRRADGSDLPVSDRPLARALRGDLFVDEEILLIHIDGATHHVLASGMSTTQDGKIALAILVFRDTTERAHSESMPSVVHAAPRRGRVLIIDDEPAMGRAVTRVLQNDHDVVAYIDPLDAMHHLSTDDAFDVVLCDLTMPRMSGIELYEAVKAKNPALAKKIVFITGGACTSEAQEFLRTTQSPTLGKPLDTYALRQTVLEYASLSLEK